MYGECSLTDGMCQKWFAVFRAGDFSLDNAPWLGRTVEVDNIQIKTVIKNNQHYTMWEIANILKIYKSIKLSVKRKKYIFLFYGKKTKWNFWPTQ